MIIVYLAKALFVVFVVQSIIFCAIAIGQHPSSVTSGQQLVALFQSSVGQGFAFDRQLINALFNNAVG